MRYVHTNMRVRDVDASLRFYEALGYERRGRLQFEGAYNLYLGLPGDGDTLELTVNEGQAEPYDLGSGYGHIALSVEDLDGMLERLAAAGIEPEKPPYHPGGREEFRICFVQDPDGYRIELIDGAFETPQDQEGNRCCSSCASTSARRTHVKSRADRDVGSRGRRRPGAMDAGAIKHAWKVSGQRVVLAVCDFPDAETLDRALSGLPIIGDGRDGEDRGAADLRVHDVRGGSQAGGRRLALPQPSGRSR